MNMINPIKPTATAIHKTLQSVDHNKLSANYVKYDRTENKSDITVEQALVDLKELSGVNLLFPDNYDSEGKRMGDKDASFLLAVLYSTGSDNVSPCDLIAVRFFELAHQQGHVLAALFLTVIYLNAGNDTEAKADQWQSKIPQGVMTHYTKFMQSDEVNKYPDMHYGAGLLFAQAAKLVKQDDSSLSQHYLTMAGEEFGKLKGSTHPGLNYKLGMMYFNGDKVAIDLKLAATYFNEAHKNGHPDAAYQLGMLNFMKTGNLEAAVKCLKAAHNKKTPHPDAAFQLGHIYVEQKKMEDAMKCYTIAESMGHESAKHSLAICAFLYGEQLMDTNEKKAIEMFRLATVKGHQGAKKKVEAYDLKRQQAAQEASENSFWSYFSSSSSSSSI